MKVFNQMKNGSFDPKESHLCVMGAHNIIILIKFMIVNYKTKACCGLTFLSFPFSFIPLVPGVEFSLLNWFSLGSSHVSLTKTFSFVC